MRSDYYTFRLAQLMHVVVYLLIVCGLLRYFKKNRDGSLILLGHYPYSITGRPSYMQKVKSKVSLIKNPRDRHVHNSLSNVVITCLVLTSIVQDIIMVFLRVHLATSD